MVLLLAQRAGSSCWRVCETQRNNRSWPFYCWYSCLNCWFDLVTTGEKTHTISTLFREGERAKGEWGVELRLFYGGNTYTLRALLLFCQGSEWGFSSTGVVPRFRVSRVVLDAAPSPLLLRPFPLGLKAVNARPPICPRIYTTGSVIIYHFDLV